MSSHPTSGLRICGAALLLCLLVHPRPAAAAQDLALAANGGHLVYFSSQYDDSSWRAANLIDGSADHGWSGQSGGGQTVIIGFKDGRLAEIEDVLINPYSRESPNNWAKDVEILASDGYPFRGYRSLGQMTLAQEGRNQLFTLPAPVEARYVKVRFLSNHGGGFMQAGAIQVMGTLVAGAPPAPRWTDLAAASAGGTIASHSSQYDEGSWAVANLLSSDGKSQWSGTSSGSQEVVVGLARAALISDVAVDNYSRESDANWAQGVSIEVSASSPYKGFQPVGRLTLPRTGDLHTLTLPEPMTAQYVKVLFGTNHGGGFMQAARVCVFATEAAPSGELARQLQETGRAVVREIHFAFNSADILPDSEAVLRQIAEVLEADPALELVIEGHTDGVGGAEFNLELSRRRAEAVRAWLVERSGVAAARLATAGYGLTRPVADNSTEDGRALNRRVELVRKS